MSAGVGVRSRSDCSSAAPFVGSFASRNSASSAASSLSAGPWASAGDANIRHSNERRQRMDATSSAELGSLHASGNVLSTAISGEDDTVSLIVPHLLIAVVLPHLPLGIAGDEVMSVGQAHDGVRVNQVERRDLTAVGLVLDDALLVVVRHDDVAVGQHFKAAENQGGLQDVELLDDLLRARVDTGVACLSAE